MAEAIIAPVRDEIAADPGPITADLGTIVTRAARRFGSKTALVAAGRTLTYQALDDLCDRVADGLHDIGVRPGDRVSLYSPNRWEWVVAYHAALRAGAVVNPINVMLTAEEVAFVLNDCGAAAIFTSGDKAEVIAGLTRSVPTLRRVISFDPAGGGVTGFGDLLDGSAAAPEIPRPGPADLSTIGYTSGTTGHPKGAMQSHGFNVYPAEIERVVAAHPAVAMVAVGSVPDDTHGELARAYVVLRPGAAATETEIIEHCRPHLAAYKRPRSVRFVPDLPKTSTGKVMRRELRTLDG